MEAKDTAIIALAFAVVLLVGFLFWQRGRVARGSNAVVAPSTGTKRTTKDVDTAAPGRNYTKQISQAQAYNDRAAKVFGAVAENLILAPFVDQYAQIDEAYNKFDPDRENHTEEELLFLVSSILSAAKFDNVQKDLASAADEIAKGIIAGYDEDISAIFSGKPFEDFASRYSLTADLRATQLAKISAIAVSHFSTVVMEVKDIEQRRNWLQSNYHTFVSGAGDTFDWGSAARQFGAGALAVAHPFIGVPALIANYKRDSDKAKAEGALFDRYVKLFEEFENKVQSVREQVIQAAEKTKSYAEDKCKEINVTAITAILTEMAAANCNLDHYFESLDVKQLESLEEEMFSEAA